MTPMPRSIKANVNVILTFDSRDQMFYDASVILTLPVEDFDAFELETIRQVLEPVDKAILSDLVKISLCYSPMASEGGKAVDLREDEGVQDAMQHLHRNNAKYYFQPNQRDDYEQRIVDALDIASETKNT